METGALGQVYHDGEVLLRQGATGGSMYVILQGQVEVVREVAGQEIRMAVLGEGEFVGEMEIFEDRVCVATVRALGEVRAITVDKRNLLRQITEDPTLAFHLVQSMSARVRELGDEVSRLKSDAKSWRAVQNRLPEQMYLSRQEGPKCQYC